MATTATIPHPIRLGMEARDAAAMTATLAPDVVLRSPLTSTPFEGRKAVSELLGILAEEWEHYEVVHEMADAEVHIIIARARLGGRELELVNVIRHDDEGRVREMKLFGRPMSGVATLAAVIGPRLAEHRGRGRAPVVRALGGPLPRALAAADKLGAWLALPRRR